MTFVMFLLFLCSTSFGNESQNMEEYIGDNPLDSIVEGYYEDVVDDEGYIFISNDISKEYIDSNVPPLRAQPTERNDDFRSTNEQAPSPGPGAGPVSSYTKNSTEDTEDTEQHKSPGHDEAKILKAEPLFLTPFIEAKRFSEGRRAAIVPEIFETGIISYSGFVTTFNLNYTNNMFFWYIPATKTQVPDEEVPVILWLQGGLGVALSSITGYKLEDGPDKEFSAWSRNYHMVYMDPVGLGFSFSNKSHPLTNADDMSEEYCSALHQFFQLFPELSKNDFFLAGQTNMGKYVPSIALRIHEHNIRSTSKINMKGLIIGNGRVDPKYILYGAYMAEQGLIDISDLPQILQRDEEYVIAVSEGNRNLIVKYDRMKKIMAYLESSGVSPYNYELSNLLGNSEGRLKIPASRELQKLLHGGNMEFKSFSYALLKDLRRDFDWYTPVSDIVEVLLNHKYRVLYYNGALHPVYHHSMTQKFANNLNWLDKDRYKTAERRTWWVNPNKMGGFVKTGGSLTVALIHGAGDRIFKDQPAAAANLLTKFIRNEPLSYLSGKPVSFD